MALNAAGKRLGRVLPQSTVLFVCDIQEVFRNKIFQMPTVIHSTNTLVRPCRIVRKTWKDPTHA